MTTAPTVRAAGGNVSVWAVPGAGHIGGLATAPKEWEEIVITFLDSATDG